LLLAGRFDESAAVQLDPLARATGQVLLGNGEAALPTLQASADDKRRIDVGDVNVSRGIALTQTGRFAEAVAVLTTRLELATAPGPRAHTLAALALATGANGDTTRARELAEQSLASGGNYVDRSLALAAAACAAAHDRDVDDVAELLDRLRHTAGSTEDRVTPAVMALATAQALAAIDDPFAGSAFTDARRRLDALGIDAAGWQRAFAAASRAGEASAPA
jgi:hypothetical protein